MADTNHRLRVALVAGALSQGGAEKQLTYMARALLDAGVEVRIYCLTRGQFYESALRSLGLQPIWVGQHPNPLMRVVVLAQKLRSFRPHIIQSTHFFTNMHVSLVARLSGSMAIGSIRNDTMHELKGTGRWGPWLLRLPPSILANSRVARDNAIANGVRPEAAHTLFNVIDLSQTDVEAQKPQTSLASGSNQVIAMAVCRLVEAKRLDRFLTALSIARREAGNLKGVVVGDGPVRSSLEAKAGELGLLPDDVQFLGRRDDVPSLLKQADMLVVSSDHEGFPNVVLEAMSAGLPVVTMPAGDAGVVVQDGVTGYVVPFDDIEGMAARMVTLAKSPDLRRQFGAVGRELVEQHYSFESLADRLLSVYRDIAEQQGNRKVITALNGSSPRSQVSATKSAGPMADLHGGSQ